MYYRTTKQICYWLSCEPHSLGMVGLWEVGDKWGFSNSQLEVGNSHSRLGALAGKGLILLLQQTHSQHLHKQCKDSSHQAPGSPSWGYFLKRLLWSASQPALGRLKTQTFNWHNYPSGWEMHTTGEGLKGATGLHSWSSACTCFYFVWKKQSTGAHFKQWNQGQYLGNCRAWVTLSCSWAEQRTAQCTCQ